MGQLISPHLNPVLAPLPGQHPDQIMSQLLDQAPNLLISQHLNPVLAPVLS